MKHSENINKLKIRSVYSDNIDYYNLLFVNFNQRDITKYIGYLTRIIYKYGR